jgi:hypothetical protein
VKRLFAERLVSHISRVQYRCGFNARDTIMSQTFKSDTPWRAHAVVSVAEAAAIFDRSTSWVRDRLTDNALELAPDAKRIAITIRSVVRLSERMAESRAARNRTAERPWLRLVVDNGQK